MLTAQARSAATKVERRRNQTSRPSSKLVIQPTSASQAAKGKYPLLKKTDWISFGGRAQGTSDTIIGNYCSPAASHSPPPSPIHRNTYQTLVLLGLLQSKNPSHRALGNLSRAQVQHSVPRNPTLHLSQVIRHMRHLPYTLPTSRYLRQLVRLPQMRHLHLAHFPQTRRPPLKLARPPRQLVPARPLEVRMCHTLLQAHLSPNAFKTVEVKSRRPGRNQCSIGTQPLMTYHPPKILSTGPASRSRQRRPQQPFAILPTMILVTTALDVRLLNA